MSTCMAVMNCLAGASNDFHSQDKISNYAFPFKLGVNKEGLKMKKLSSWDKE